MHVYEHIWEIPNADVALVDRRELFEEFQILDVALQTYSQNRNCTKTDIWKGLGWSKGKYDRYGQIFLEWELGSPESLAWTDGESVWEQCMDIIAEDGKLSQMYDAWKETAK